MTEFKSTQVGRLAFRREGKWWRCYLAPLHNWDGATEIGSIRLNIAEDSAEAKAAFMDAMKVAFTVISQRVLGQTPTFPDPPQPAPESERGGNA